MDWEITPKDAKLRLQQSKPVLLDVRREDEHAYTAIPDSILIPLHELPARLGELEPHREREIIVYCHHGVRSLAGTEMLRAAGFSAVSLQGGIDAYSLEVMPSLKRY